MRLPNVIRTGCDGLGPQLVVLELRQVSPHEATGLEGLERHEGVGDVGMCCGGRGEGTEDPRSDRGECARPSPGMMM